MIKKVLFTLIFMLVAVVFYGGYYLVYPPVTRVEVSGFEEKERILREKYPPYKDYTWEELNAMDAEVKNLIDKKIQKLKQQEELIKERERD